VLRKYGLRARKHLGQNFLQDPHALERIATIAEIQPDDTVLEIGPGLGSLTRYLAASAKNVIAVELDDDLFPVLEAVLSPYRNIHLVHGDILDIETRKFIQQSGYLVVANIPYYITSAVLRHLLENKPRPRRMVLTIQLEVAERICASAGGMSLLALSVQVYGSPYIAAKIPAHAFYPKPRVESAVLVVEVHGQPVIPFNLLDTFFQLIKAGFSQKRKMLRNSLSAGMHLTTPETEQLLIEAGIDPKRRAETVELDEWYSLSKNIKNRRE
jgi:16S rRNA (adenine1518-N6/adenine1519-N6)-dimethyltransferase